MDQPVFVTVAVAIGIGLLLVIGFGFLLARFYRQVAQGQVLIVNTMKTEPKVSFTGAVVIPIINRAEVMDISLKTIEIDRRGKQGLICADNIRADIKVSFFVRVNKTVDSVLKVAGAVGCARASDQGTLNELFEAKFSEGLKTVGKRLNFEDLYKEREVFKDQIVQVIGKDLNGYLLEDAAIDYLEQTPLEKLDPKLTNGATADVFSQAMVAAVTQIARVCGFFTVAKSVESDTMRDHCRSLGLDFVQGFAVSGPAPLESIPSLEEIAVS